MPRWAVLFSIVVLLASAVGAARRPLQQDALSNSNGCLETIPKCEPGACATRNIMGVARWVCLRCLANYESVVDASGQDNIVQCVCPRGSYESAPNATRCLRCPKDAFCPGGDRVQQPLTRGSLSQCGPNLVTRNSGARSQADCVAPAGFALTSPTGGATPCSASEYAPALNRLARCLRCQSGLAEPSSSNLTDGQRASKRAVCKIPPGRYSSQGLIRTCPQGFYRERYVDFDAPVGTLCLPCNPGITTEGAAAGFAFLCNKVIVGYGIDSVYNVTGPASVPALPQSDTAGLPNATLCGIGFYSLGGWCAQCPNSTVTRVMGAKSIEECVVPPGYFLAGGPLPAMILCEAGTYRESWVGFSDPKARSCTACGTGISSEPRDLDENPLATNGSLVRASPASCCIEAGMGMIAEGRNKFTGMECPVNAYGAAGKVYGLTAAPCKPCPRNMITDGQTRVNNSDACINDDGFGYASEGASRCAPGFYAAKGSRKPCQQCPVGRSTLDVASMQRTISDCRVNPGFGIVGSGNGSSGGAMPCGDAFNPDVTGLDSLGLAAFAVLECPVGYFSGEFTVGAKCLACPVGSTTQAPGSTNITDCNVCIAGYGRPAVPASPCSLCPRGSQQPGGLTECQACPSVPFYPPVDGAGPVWFSNSTTLFQGAYGAEACVPVHSQLSPEAGQAYFAEESPLQVLLTSAPQPDLGSCLASCASDSCCLAQYNTAIGVCKTATLAPASMAGGAATGHLLMYKLPPSTLGSASSIDQKQKEQRMQMVSGKMIASGYYAACSIPAGSISTWVAGAGTNLGPDARTFSAGGAVWDAGTTVAACKARCDNSNVCWGFIWNAASASCLYRGGVDALSTRSFFVLPSTVDMESLAWASSAASGAVNGPSGVASCSVLVSVNGSVGVLQNGSLLNTTLGSLQSNVTTSNTTGNATGSTGNTTQAAQGGSLPSLPGQGALPIPPQQGALPIPPQGGALPAAPSPVVVNGCSPNSCSSMANSNGTCTVVPAPGTGFTCGCNHGYMWNSTKRQCVDIDGCSPNPCNNIAHSTSQCTDIPAPGTGFICGCETGYAWNNVSNTCEDVNGCAPSNPCPSIVNSNGTCTDVAAPGTGFTCGCNTGYMWNSTIQQCEDIDNCSPNPCSSVAHAINQCTDISAPGTGFICGCETGYAWNNVSNTCEDANACLPTNPCPSIANSNGTCTDVAAPGTGLTCGCNTGFMWNSTNQLCEDIDGCNPNPCSSIPCATSQCTDIPAPGTGFICGCDTGYAWNNVSNTCEDFNGCASQPCSAISRSNGTCTDLPPPSTGFTCGCNTGYSWNGTACIACPEPPAPPANSGWPTNCNGALSGARCVAICNPGWVGSPYRTCSSGTWSEVVGNCTVPAVGSIITTVAGIYQNMTPNYICQTSPSTKYCPQLLGDGGPATAAPIGTISDVVQDESANLFFVDAFVGVVRRVDNKTGIMTTIAGNSTARKVSGDGGPANKAFFNVPRGLALWQGCLYVADDAGGTVRRINLTTNIITTVVGNATLGMGYSGDGGPATLAQASPTAVAIDPRNGDILIADYNRPRVRRVSAATGIITTIAGNGTNGIGLNKDWGMGGLANQTAIAVPRGITVDAAGNVYFACDIGSVVQKVDTAGRISIVTGKLTDTSYTGNKGPAGNATVWNPTDVKVDAAGNIFVADPYNRVIRRIDAETGIINTIIGNGNKVLPTPSGDGGHPIRGQIGSAATGGTMRIFLGPFGDMFLADHANYAVRKVTLYQTLR